MKNKEKLFEKENHPGRDNQYIAENLNGTLWQKKEAQNLTVKYDCQIMLWVAILPTHRMTTKTPEKMIKNIKELDYTFKGWI